MSLASALRLLTRFRIPGKEIEQSGRTLFWFPIVGALLGCISCLFALIPLSAPIRSVLVLIGGVYFTRALHYDGVADLADGLGGGFTKERSLEIMRDSHIGAFGTIALMLVVLLQYSLLLDVVEHPPMLILVPALGRLAQVWAASLMNYAREGEGMASSLVRRAKWHHALLPTLQVGLLILLLFVLHHPYAIPVLAAFGGIVLSTTILCLISRKRLGGITGDVLGSVEVFGETAALLGIVFALA